MEQDKIRKTVRERYAGIAGEQSSCCGPASTCEQEGMAEMIGRRIGYTEKDMQSVPEGSNLGLGCGNPTALASLKPGETVLDLGSGAGFDCFLASREVGPEGRVIGVDMTPEMIEKARENAKRGGYGNVEFRLGEIENLPVADGTVDAVISNCVINLSPEKRRVFDEAYRVLKPGGRMMISDLVLSKTLPESVKESVSAYVGCIAGAMPKDEYLATISAAGFEDVRIEEESGFPVSCFSVDPVVKGLIEDLSVSPGAIEAISGSVSSVKVHGVKRAAIDFRTTELIAIGASVAANCRPCLQHHVDNAREHDIAAKEIAGAIEVGRMVAKGAAASMKRFASDLTSGASTSGAPVSPGCGCPP